METSVAEIGKNKFRLTVEVPPGDLEKFLERTYRRLAREVRVPGFRPGKAPRPVIEQRLGKDFVRSEVLRDALPELYMEALGSSELEAVAPPEIDVKSFEDGEGLSFEATIETRPTPELKEYSGLKVTRPPTEVGEEEVAEQLEQLRVRFSSLEVVSRPLGEGDFALIDLTTYRHDEVVDEATAKDLLVEVGAGMIVPELDTELQGKRSGDILKITATLPERFGERAGWQVGMQILVKEVKARKLPELDDDFAKTASEFDTLEELRTDLRGVLERMKERQAENQVKERAIEAFLEEGMEVDLPEGMVGLEVDSLVETFVRMLASQGVSVEHYLQHENLDVDALRQRFREQAEKNLALRLGLEEVARQEAIEVGEEDRRKELERWSERMGRPVSEIEETLSERGDLGSLDGDIMRAKALDLLVARADITTEDSP